MNFAGLLPAFLFLLLLLGVAWILCRPLAQETSLDPAETIEDLLPLHTQHFPQLRQSLDSADARFLRRRVSKEVERSWSAERKQIVRDYLTSLAGDFARALRLAGIADSLAPRVANRDALARYSLALRFRALYRVIRVCVSAGSPKVLRRIARLTGYVGSLSALGEAAMERLESSCRESGVRSNLNA